MLLSQAARTGALEIAVDVFNSVVFHIGRITIGAPYFYVRNRPAPLTHKVVACSRNMSLQT